MKSTRDLQSHIYSTYFALRIGVAAIAFVLPFALGFGGYLWGDMGLQESMSAYYHAGDGVVRDIFVGVLWAVGAILFLYKGFTDLENYALNLAGVLVVLVAVVPMPWGDQEHGQSFTWHGLYSALYFISLAYVCMFRASDTLKYLEDQALRKKYKSCYSTLGILMVAVPAIVFILSKIFQQQPRTEPWLFFIEASGVYIFAIYWIVKSYEMKNSQLEKLAMEGKLRVVPFNIGDAFKEIAIERIDVVDMKLEADGSK